MPQTDELELVALAQAKRWDDLETAWASMLEQSDPPAAMMLECLEVAGKSGREDWAALSASAWISHVRDNSSPKDALALTRTVLQRIPGDGSIFRDDVLSLFKHTYADTANLEVWLERSGLPGKSSLRKALRFLDVALKLEEGLTLLHRGEETAAEVISVDADADEVELKLPRGTSIQSLDRVIDDYRPTRPNDFRVLQQLYPDRISALAEKDPVQLVIGVLIAHGGELDRDAMKVLLTPRYMDAKTWGSWWTKLRSEIKKSAHITIEGRSPMMLIFHEGGKSVEEAALEAYHRAETPRDLLSCIESYFRECKDRKCEPQTAFLNQVTKLLGARVNKLAKHDHDAAFAVALVIERLAQEGLPMPENVHGIAVNMMRDSDHPVQLILSLPDQSTWPLALEAARESLPERWPEIFSKVLPRAPGSQCDVLSKAIATTENARVLLQNAVDIILERPDQNVEGLMWLWKGSDTLKEINVPPLMDLLGRVLKLVGPARETAGQISSNELRATVRAGLSARRYARFRECVAGQGDAMGAALRRQIERAEGLGPAVQSELLEIIREYYPKLFLRALLQPWEDLNVLWTTDAGRRRRDAELDELVTVKLRENAIAIGKAVEHGDLSENSEYKFALEERDLLHARITKMQSESSIAKVLTPDHVPTTHVGIGHCVTLEGVGHTGSRKMTILGPWDSNMAKNIFSYQAPLALRLLGKKVGDHIRMPAEGGDDEMDFKITAFDSVID